MSPTASLAAASWQADTGAAVIAGEERWDYSALAVRVAARAELLRSQGLAAGQVVLAPDVPALDLLVMQHALARLGCGLLPFSPSCDEGHGEALLRSAGVEWRWWPDTGALVSTKISRPLSAASAPCPALLIETSGSSGFPKLAMLTTENVLASAMLVNARLGLAAGDSWLSCLPRSHVGGLMIGYRCALAGATVVLHEGFDAGAVAADLTRHGVTHLSLVPAMLARLLAVAEEPPPDLRVLLVGGQSLSGVLARQAIEAGWPLHLTYGMTETASQVATSPRLDAAPMPGLVGLTLPGIEVRCAGTPDAPTPISLRGPVVMSGYANPERRPGDGLEDGWLPTNDLGYLTTSGELAVLGRADELLVIGGEAVLPSRVEDRLLGAPGVDAVVVLACDEFVWGHRLVAVYAGDAEPDRLEAWCRESLSDRERPRAFRRWERLPVLDSGKPDRRRIGALMAETWPGDEVGGVGAAFRGRL